MNTQAEAHSMRTLQVTLMVSLVWSSWLFMQAVHELGHVTAAWLSGANVDRVVLSPVTISRTDVSANHHPLFVVWAGPVVGVCLPIVMWLITKRVGMRAAYLFRFLAGFCLVGNGLYIAVGSIDHVGDCHEMLRHGSAVWMLWAFGVLTVPAGFWMWHGQGLHLGLGPSAKPLVPSDAWAMLGTAVLLTAIGFAVGGH